MTIVVAEVVVVGLDLKWFRERFDESTAKDSTTYLELDYDGFVIARNELEWAFPSIWDSSVYQYASPVWHVSEFHQYLLTLWSGRVTEEEC